MKKTKFYIRVICLILFISLVFFLKNSSSGFPRIRKFRSVKKLPDLQLPSNAKNLPDFGVMSGKHTYLLKHNLDEPRVQQLFEKESKSPWKFRGVDIYSLSYDLIALPALLATAENWLRPHSVTQEELSKTSSLELTEAVEYGRPLVVKNAKRLSPKEAKYLSDYKGSALILFSLEELSPAVAGCLSSFEGPLWLPNIKTINPETAEKLSQHRGFLSLDGLRSLNNETAVYLEKHEGSLSLNNITSLSIECAKHLAEVDGHLFLNNLYSDNSLSSTDTDETELKPTSSVEIPAGVAKLLATHKGSLSLCGLSKLPTSIATELREHTGRLFLTGLTEFSPISAKLISDHAGDLVFGDLSMLNRDAGEILATRKDDIAISKVGFHSPSLIKWAITNDKALDLSALRSLTLESASALATSKDDLRFPSVENITTEVAESLARHKGILSFPKIAVTSKDLANAIASHEGPVEIGLQTKLFPVLLEKFLQQGSTEPPVGQVTSLSPEVALVLNKFNRPMDFSRLEEVSPESIAAFKDCDASINFPILPLISRELAEAFAALRCDLSFGIVHNLEQETAELFSGHQGALSLPGIRLVDIGTAKALAAHKGPINLTGLDFNKVSFQCEDILRQNPAIRLPFNGNRFFLNFLILIAVALFTFGFIWFCVPAKKRSEVRDVESFLFALAYGSGRLIRLVIWTIPKQVTQYLMSLNSPMVK